VWGWGGVTQSAPDWAPNRTVTESCREAANAQENNNHNHKGRPAAGTTCQVRGKDA